MKKYSLIFAFVAFAVAVALNFSISKEGSMDDVALANVEALADEYSDKIWDIYNRADGGHNCCKPGSSSCY